MKTVEYVYWQDGELWLGYFEEYPDYWTQGETLKEIKENPRDLHKDLTSGEIPAVRRVARISLR